MCLGDCIKKHVFKMTTFLFMILFVIMVILYVKEKNVSVSKWYGGYDINYGKRLKPRYIYSGPMIILRIVLECKLLRLIQKYSLQKTFTSKWSSYCNRKFINIFLNCIFSEWNVRWVITYGSLSVKGCSKVCGADKRDGLMLSVHSTIVGDFKL